MYPDLSYILHALIGTEPDNATSVVKTFGLFLVITFLVAAYILDLEFKRREKNGVFKPIKNTRTVGQGVQWPEVATSAIFGCIVGYKVLYVVQYFPEFKADAAGVILSLKGSLLGAVLGAAFNGFLKYWQQSKAKLPKPKVITEDIYPHQRIGDITMLAALSGIIGAKLFAIFETVDNFEHFWEQLFSGSGMAIYGGLIVAFAAVFWYVKKQGIPPIEVMDAVAPALMLGYGIGRIGCQLSGDGDWGIPNLAETPDWWLFPEWLWAYDYPQNVLNLGVPIEGCDYRYCKRLAEPRFPTPVYETIYSTLAFIFLWSIRKRITIPGILFFIYLILNGVERFFIEKIRVNDKLITQPFEATQAEIIAVSFVLIGIGSIWYLYRQARSAEEV